MNLNMTVGQAACRLLCRYTQSTLAESCFAELHVLLRVNQVKELVAVCVEMHLISGVTDKWQGENRPLGKLNVKTGPSPSLYFVIYHSFGFQ